VTRLNEGEDYSGKAIDAPTSFYVGVAVNPSAEDLETELERFRQKLAFRLHNEVPGITIPEGIQQQLGDAGADAKRVGFDLARRLMNDARERAAGIYVIPPFKEPAAALDLLAP
jgi:homocysteine S-methyltransferase